MTAMDTNLSPTDETDIIDVYSAYSWAVDTGDIEQARTLFTEEATVEESLQARVAPVRLSAPEYLNEMWRDAFTPGHQHWFDQFVVSGEGDDCTVACFLMKTYRSHIGTASSVIDFLGHCSDRLRRVDGRWLFVSRSVRPWSGPVLSGFPTYPAVEDES